MASPVVILFARAARLGGVKRRLAAGIGDIPSLRFYRNQLTRIIRELAKLRGFDVTIALTPRRTKIRAPKHFKTINQSAGDLGSRMHAAFNHYPNRPVILIGADIPHLTTYHIRSAARALKTHHAAFGPAADGGFYLTAMGRNRPARPFANTTWSTPQTLAETLRNFTNHRVSTLATLQDVDTKADLAQLTTCALRRTP